MAATYLPINCVCVCMSPFVDNVDPRTHYTQPIYCICNGQPTPQLLWTEWPTLTTNTHNLPINIQCIAGRMQPMANHKFTNRNQFCQCALGALLLRGRKRASNANRRNARGGAAFIFFLLYCFRQFIKCAYYMPLAH